MGKTAVITTPAPGNASDAITGNANTTAIINEYVSIIDTEKEYTLKELRDILSEVYKTKTGTVKKTKKAKKDSDADSSDNEPKKRVNKKKDETKPKKKLSGYNIFVRKRMLEMKDEQPDGKLRMAAAASEWKTLTDEEKLSYKPKEEDSE